jgi:hypothetical protein
MALPRARRGVALVVIGVAVAIAAVSCGSSGSGAPRGTDVFPEKDHSHTAGTVTYDRTPPAGGAHSPIPQNCGIYEEPVINGDAVHSLEHGAVWITYKPDLPTVQVMQLTSTAVTHYKGPQRYVLLSPYTGLPTPIVVTAWGAQLRLDSATDPRLAAFIDHYAGGGQGGEKSGACSGGTGTPTR